MLDNKERTETHIENLRNHIEKEKENMTKMQHEIQKETRRINNITKRINNTDVTIKKLSQVEKRMLGRKLYNQQVSEINRVMIKRKREHQRVEQSNQTINQLPSQTVQQEPPKIEQEPQQSINSSPVTPQIEIVEEIPQKQAEPSIDHQNTQQSVLALVNCFNMMQQLGVNFTPNTTALAPVQNPELINNPVTSMNNIQAMIAFYSMGCIANQLYQNFQQQLMSQQQREKSTNRSLGFVNLPLLISIILFIISLFLFFIK